mmetsp:Transcript_11131/g.38674  ORF Transcript_11131/g.38674 Transcript_11131/m.38674 type:complete len:220 (+) Transcript_11131:2234-2893(+)
MSRRPSIVPRSCASVGCQNVMCPSSVATATRLPSGRKARARQSCWWSSASTPPFRSNMSHTRSVLSQLQLTKIPSTGLNSRPETGAVCPAITSSRFPLFTSQHITSKVSMQPAAMISPEGSTASVPNWTALGPVKVLKLRYLARSYARTVPSSEALTTALLVGLLGLWRNATAETGASWFLKVMKHCPSFRFHTLTLLSSAPVTTWRPSRLYATALMSK